MENLSEIIKKGTVDSVGIKKIEKLIQDNEDLKKSFAYKNGYDESRTESAGYVEVHLYPKIIFYTKESLDLTLKKINLDLRDEIQSLKAQLVKYNDLKIEVTAFRFMGLLSKKKLIKLLRKLY